MYRFTVNSELVFVDDMKLIKEHWQFYIDIKMRHI